MNIFLSVILLFGGQGTRMKSKVPKQYLKIHEKEIFKFSLDFFSHLQEVNEIIIVCEKEYVSLFKSERKLIFANGGKRRQDSVYNGLLMTDPKSNMICIHDGARPFLNYDEVKKTLEVAIVHGAAALGSKVKNTIKQLTDSFVRTLDRNELYEIYTPQIIQKKLLLEGFTKAIKENIEVTDDLSLIELLGKKTKIVEGSDKNIKITTSFDLKLAELIYEQI